MSRRARRILIVVGSLAAVALLLGLSAILALRSDWFREKVRQRIVAEVEKATGGRTEIGAFRFDWKQLRAEVDGFVLHGSEPANAPPLVRADAIVVGIKIVSVLNRSVDLQYLDVRHPQVYVILYPDGHTNLPAPKVRRAGKGTLETILDLAIGRFSLQDGSFEVSGQGKTPFDAQGRNLRAQFDYDAAGLRYRGQLSIAPAAFHWGGYRPVPLDMSLALAVEKNRVRIDSGRVSTGQSQAEFSGAIDSLTDFSGAFQYKVRASLAEVTRTLGWRTQLEGPVTLAGKASFHGTSDYQASGALHAAGLLLRLDPQLLARRPFLVGVWRGPGLVGEAVVKDDAKRQQAKCDGPANDEKQRAQNARRCQRRRRRRQHRDRNRTLQLGRADRAFTAVRFLVGQRRRTLRTADHGSFLVTVARSLIDYIRSAPPSKCASCSPPSPRRRVGNVRLY